MVFFGTLENHVELMHDMGYDINFYTRIVYTISENTIFQSFFCPKLVLINPDQDIQKMNCAKDVYHLCAK